MKGWDEVHHFLEKLHGQTAVSEHQFKCSCKLFDYFDINRSKDIVKGFRESFRDIPAHKGGWMKRSIEYLRPLIPQTAALKTQCPLTQRVPVFSFFLTQGQNSNSRTKCPWVRRTKCHDKIEWTKCPWVRLKLAKTREVSVQMWPVQSSENSICDDRAPPTPSPLHPAHNWHICDCTINAERYRQLWG